PIGPVSDETESTVTFSVTPAAGAGPGLNKIAAMLTSGQATGYTDGVMQIVPPVEGRFHRWGKWEEYDRWLSETAPQARRVGRSAAVVSMGLGETIRFSVDVHNWSDAPQTGSVTLTVPTGFAADATSKPYGTLAPDADVSVPFTLTNTVTSLASSNTVNGQTYSVGIATSFSAPASSSSESLAVSLVPTTTIPGVATAPALDGAEGAGEYPGPALGLGTSWQGIPGCVPAGISCGSAGAAGTPTSTYAKVARHGDDLYLFIHVRDDYQSYAVKPDECFAHWLTDSVEILLDPRGNSSQTNFDTGTTFKLAVFPFSNDPQNVNGQGANGPCWSRDADNHQGFSVGPLADTVPDAPNAPGVKVVSTAEWVGTNEITTPHGYGPEGSYDLEVKIPMSVLPAAVGPTDPAPTASAATNVADPLHLGLNITPYDADLSAAPGTTTLQRGNLVSSLVSTRLGWSAYGSVQSDPWRWGHAYLDGYTPPEGRPIDPPNPIVAPGLKGVDSPQSIYQSAHDGVPIAGRPPADAVETVTASLEPGSVEIDVRAIEAARAHIFLWNGDHGAIPVWATSCTPENDPPPDYGFTACGPTDGGVPPWSPDMSGRLLGDLIAPVETGTNHFSIPIDSAAHDRMAAAGSVLISFEDATGANQAFDLNLTTGAADRTGTS
ncbi:MAG TPA: sugar-binding protein, partial [Actinomycetota bacterium]